jgi:hypothetical protein
MSSSQPESGSNGSLTTYMEMLLSFGKIPEWHRLLSILLIQMITTGFIIMAAALISFQPEELLVDGQTQLVSVPFLELTVSQCVQFHFTAFFPRFHNKKDRVLQNFPLSLFKTSFLSVFRC